MLKAALGLTIVAELACLFGMESATGAGLCAQLLFVVCAIAGMVFFLLGITKITAAHR